MPACRILLADEGYDSDAILRQVEAAGAASNIPAEINRRWKRRFSPVLYRQRNAVDRMCYRLKTSATPSRWRTSAQSVAFGPMAAVTEPDTDTMPSVGLRSVLPFLTFC